MSYTDTCDPIIMYCLGIFVVVYSKQCCLQRNKYYIPVSSGDGYLHSYKISLLYVVSFFSYASSI